MLKKVRIAIKTIQKETSDSLFEDTRDDIITDGASEEQVLEFSAEGSYYDDGVSVRISYREGEALEDSRTTLSFAKSDPTHVTMTREGAVRCSISFEAGHLDHSPYLTPYMPFQLATKTKRVYNDIEKNGTLRLEYTAQLKGAQAQHTVFVLCVHEGTKQ